ncbi:hypothetical protein ACU4HD_47590 [Cupriavidus basilensis]
MPLTPSRALPRMLSDRCCSSSWERRKCRFRADARSVVSRSITVNGAPAVHLDL